MTETEPDLLAVVEQSPRAAAAHDRAAWVGLFTDDGRIEDPVGSRPHLGPAQIGAFYDTFIAPREIEFHRDLDIVGDTAVVRDLELEVAMGGGVTMRIPAFLRYDLRKADGVWSFVRLRAYWELPAMVRQFLRNGASAVPAGLQLSRALLRNQRLVGAAGFMMGFRPGVNRNKHRVTTLLSAAGRGDRRFITGMLSPDASVALADNDTADLGRLVDELGAASPTKMIGAGRTVVASIDSGRGRGVLFADLARRGAAITGLRYLPG